MDCRVFSKRLESVAIRRGLGVAPQAGECQKAEEGQGDSLVLFLLAVMFEVSFLFHYTVFYHPFTGGEDISNRKRGGI